MIEIKYIWHDCFVISTDDITIIFDYWKDDTVPYNSLPRFIEEANKDKPTYVVVSHFHKDHYTKAIFSWSGIFKNIKYIISKDVARHAKHILNRDSIYNGPKPDSGSIVILKSGEKYSDKNIAIEAFGSTDIGNSYYIEAGGKGIFHAGDLNAWIWMDESTKPEIEEALNNYKAILKTISEKHKSIDYVMFPVDSRIGSGYYTGAKLFVREIVVKHFFPMHFELGIDAVEKTRYHADAVKIELYANPERGEYICLQNPYSRFVSYD